MLRKADGNDDPVAGCPLPGSVPSSGTNIAKADTRAQDLTLDARAAPSPDRPESSATQVARGVERLADGGHDLVPRRLDFAQPIAGGGECVLDGFDGGEAEFADQRLERCGGGDPGGALPR